MKKKGVLLCLLLCIFFIAGCGNKKLEEAKEYVDSIYSSYNQIDKAEAKLQSETDADKREKLEREIRIANNLIENNTERLAEIYVDLSESQQKEVDDYLSSIVGKRIQNIWND